MSRRESGGVIDELDGIEDELDRMQDSADRDEPGFDRSRFEPDGDDGTDQTGASDGDQTGASDDDEGVDGDEGAARPESDRIRGDEAADPPDDLDREVERVDSGEWAVVAALALVGVGIVVGSPVLVVAATLPLWYVAAVVFASERSPRVRVKRRLAVGEEADFDEDDESGSETSVSGDPGDTVTVRTTVENVGPDPILDLRIVDGVPDALPVVSGTPRRCVTLDPGEIATVEYELCLQRGQHEFGDVTIRARGLSGAVAETWTAAVAGTGAVDCLPAVESVPLEGGTNDYAGEVPTDEGGSGVEFYSVRDYEPGDPVSSIDWRRYANTRELATVEYRAERATRIVCIVDVRSSQFEAATTSALPAAELSTDAAERTFETLVDAGHPTGVVRIQNRSVDAIPPGTDPATRKQVEDLLEVTSASDWGTTFLTRRMYADLSMEVPKTLPGEAQVYLFSSFVDDAPVDLVEVLRIRGYAVRVVSPDVTDGEDVEIRLEALDRKNRLARVRATGARVIDWKRDRPLGLVLRNAIGEVATR